MFFIGVFLCVVIAIVIGAVIPKKADYNKLDRIGFIFNIILSILYVPMSLYGIFSFFAADSMFRYSKEIQKIIELMITVGTTLPFISVLGIALSVVFRKNGKRILGFTIQFVPLIIFVIMVVIFELISNVQV